ncbi:MAG: hypothetical protein QG549_438 [Patescibacteria group bacterium]|nr:hypothetical protein [Patescibacteria group bacterium]
MDTDKHDSPHNESIHDESSSFNENSVDIPNSEPVVDIAEDTMLTTKAEVATVTDTSTTPSNNSPYQIQQPPSQTNTQSPRMRFLFKLFLALLVASIVLPKNVLDILQVPLQGIYQLLIIIGLPMILFILTVLFGFLSAREPKEKTLWKMSRISGSILAIFLVFDLISHVIPGVWVLDFLGLHIWVGSVLAIVCLFTSVIGLALSLLSRNGSISALHKLFYLVFVAISVGAFFTFTMPIISYFNEQYESQKNKKPVNLPKTADEWVTMNASDYSLVKKNIDSCNVADVKVKSKDMKSTSAQYLSVQLWSPQPVIDPYINDEINRRYLILPYKEKDDLKSDMNAATQCSKTKQLTATTLPSTSTPTPTPSTVANQAVVQDCSTLPAFKSPPVLQYGSTVIFKSYNPTQKQIITAWTDTATMSPISYKDLLVAVDRNCKSIDIATLGSGDNAKLYLHVGYANFYNDALAIIQKMN